MILPDNVFDASDTYADDRQSLVGGGDSIYPTKTWRLDFNTGRIREVIEGEEALNQFILKALRTARNKFVIYNDQYGTDLNDLIGRDNSRNLVLIEIPRLIEETIIYDDRIIRVYDFDINPFSSDSVFVSFKVESVYGKGEYEITL